MTYKIFKIKWGLHELSFEDWREAETFFNGLVYGFPHLYVIEGNFSTLVKCKS